MFEACSTYEAGFSEPKDFPPTDEPVWIMGKKYSALYDLDELRADVRSRLWFTYRKNFSPIGGNGPTSDNGWGCMLRCGQMVLAEALIRRHLSRDWIWDKGTFDPTYFRILRMFEDRKNAVYSIHQIAQMGVCEGKAVGQWFGPNTVAQVLRKLAVYDDWSSIVVHIAMDNTIIIDDIKAECQIVTPKEVVGHDDAVLTKAKPHPREFRSFTHRNERSRNAQQPDKIWRPLVLIIPLRLGLSDLNAIYIRGLQKCFTLKQTLGVIGGRPNHACFFIGYVGSELVYLDPHKLQPHVCLDCVDLEYCSMSEETFHCSNAQRMEFTQLDPSVAVGFYCATEEEFDQFCDQVQRIIVEQESQPLFEICKQRSWISAKGYDVRESELNSEYTTVEAVRKFDASDEEFEIL